MPWTTPNDVVEQWTGSEAPLLPNPIINRLISVAEAIIKKEIANIEQNISSGKIEVVLVQWVVSSMVQRAFQKSNDGRITFSESSGPFSQSGTYASSATALNSLTLTDAERSYLTPSDAVLTGKIAPVRIYGSEKRNRLYNPLEGFWGGNVNDCW